VTGALLFVLALLQVPKQVPSELELPGISVPEGERYGLTQPVDLWDLTSGQQYWKTAVRTKGIFGPLELRGEHKYYELRERGGRVVIILHGKMQDASLEQFFGRRVEVVGYVRELYDKQGTCDINPFQPWPQSYCDNPELPPTPDLVVSDPLVYRQNWPRLSVTIWSIFDITRLEGRPDAGDLIDAMNAAPGEKVSVLGQFGGANLDRDLPFPAPEPRAWVLRSEHRSVWVIGKAPRGNGWSFDPAYRGDVGKWLTVEGRMAPCGATLCLRASRVTIAATPKAATVE
jgi:hypothetical protein